ncbi:MAG TPA: hypothetical protein VLA61_21415 [Ideonella sp.]|uniref:hypothetical protein n=1 Tax=Ideonella sp. TaxID=1929293 RepID=UPI002BC73EC5|nr:hypothetical protein [Ideonella sp.]HSI50834.1 hypothetical protein [Ideonella sp.]
MHLVLPFASALTPPAQHAISTLALPNLERLLARLQPTGPALSAEPGEDEELSLSAPHEQVLAAAWGWPAGPAQDGLLPMAAVAAQRDGLAPVSDELGWGLLSPTHWHVGTDQVSLTDPATLGLDEAMSRTLFDALRPLFEEDGWRLQWGAPTRWYATHPSLRNLPTAALDRVIGRNVDLWLNTHPQARLIRRLQAEVQMLLYNHPANDEREARGLLPVNSFWLSGTGPTQPMPRVDAGIVHDDRLRAPALAGDWTTWAEAWAALDAGPLAEALANVTAGQAFTLSLCGERRAQTYTPRPLGWWQRGPLAPGRVHAAPLLASL